jgi:hypothetical protein
MNYLLLPMSQHCDDGIGATGQAFQSSADFLNDNFDPIGVVNNHLPISFLYRHSIELYLKSIIVVLHRTLKLSYGDQPFDGDAYVPVSGKWKRIYTVHSVATLWAHALDLLKTSKHLLEPRCSTDWQAIPDNLSDSVAYPFYAGDAIC